MGKVLSSLMNQEGSFLKRFLRNSMPSTSCWTISPFMIIDTNWRLIYPNTQGNKYLAMWASQPIPRINPRRVNGLATWLTATEKKNQSARSTSLCKIYSLDIKVQASSTLNWDRKRRKRSQTKSLRCRLPIPIILELMGCLIYTFSQMIIIS